MGLDGISVNQLRNPLEETSSEANNIARKRDNEVRGVDGLSAGTRINPDKDSSNSNNENLQDTNQKKLSQNSKKDIIKVDLSDKEKYSLSINSDDSISILDNKTGNIIQTVDSCELLKIVSHLSDSSGSIINRRF